MASNATVGGVAFLVSDKAMVNLINVESISPRVMVLELKGNPKINLVCGYSPHNEATEEDINEFYSSLISVLENVPRHNFLSVLGDMNAKMGPDDTKFSYDLATNRNGETLLDFMDEFNLFSSNNSFMKPKTQLWSFEYSSSTVGSDLRIVSASVKLSLRSSKKFPPHPMKCIDWKAIPQNKDLSEKFAIAVHNKFQLLSSSNDVELDTIDDIYSNLSTATVNTATAVLPKKKAAAKSTPSRTHIVYEARGKLKSASLVYHAKPSILKKVALITAKKNLDNSYIESEADYINGKIAEIEHLHITKQHSAAWKTISEISGKSSKPPIRLKGGCSASRLSNWTDHFKNLLGKEPIAP